MATCKKRKILTLEQHIDVINKQSAQNIAKEMDVGKTQIQSIINEKEKLLSWWKDGGNWERIYVKARCTMYGDFNNLVWEWFTTA